MNSIKKRISAGLTRSALLPQILTGITVICACALLSVTNTGCELIKSLTTYRIQFSPPYFALTTPGEQGVVKAELIWTEDGTRLHIAETWTVESVPSILESATCSPAQRSGYTDISLKCATDGSRFGASDLWAASSSSAYMVGVKASFVEPVWEAVSGGQKVVLGRRAFLPLRVENPKIQVTQTGHYNIGRFWLANFSIHTENPLEGWRYYVKATPRGINKVTGEATNYAGDERRWQGAEAFEFTGLSAAPSDDVEASYVIFDIAYQNNQGTVVREEKKVFSY